MPDHAEGGGSAPFELITIYNYPQQNRNAEGMLCVWLMQAIAAVRASRGRISRARIISHAGGLGAELRERIEFALGSRGLGGLVAFETEDRPGTPPCAAAAPAQFKLWQVAVYKLFVLCTRPSRYIFADIDAIIVDPQSIGELLDAADEQPFIAVDHQTIDGHTAQFPFKFLNAGVLAVSDPGFLKLEDVMRVANTKWCPGEDDQIRLWNLCLERGYTYTHPRIGHAWNACGAFKADYVGSAAPAAAATLTDLEFGAAVATWTRGLPVPSENNVNVRVLHYWYLYKPWHVPCGIYAALDARAASVFAAREAVATHARLAHDFCDLIVNCSFKDGSDGYDPEIPIGVCWRFAELGSAEKNRLVLAPREPLAARKTLLYVGFDETTDFARRGASAGATRAACARNLETNGFPNAGAAAPYAAFMAALADAAFVASPEGNGIDCHRHYEAWLAGAVPVIEDRACSRAKYRGLPVVWTSEAYADITEARLRAELEDIDARWRAGEFSARISTFMRVSAYGERDAATIRDRSNYWVARMTGGLLGGAGPAGPRPPAPPLASPLAPGLVSAATEAAEAAARAGSALSRDDATRVANLAMVFAAAPHLAGSQSAREAFLARARALTDYAACEAQSAPGAERARHFAQFAEDDRVSTWNDVYGRVGRVILSHFAGAREPLRVVEIGVARGGHSNHLVRQLGGHLALMFGVDPYKTNYDVNDGFCTQYGSQAVMDSMHEWVRQRMAPHGEKYALVRMPGAEFGRLVADGFFDAVYIDGSHLYEDVRDEIAVWRHKIRPGGLMLFDDYAGNFFPGVRRAVDELAESWGVPLRQCEEGGNPVYVVVPGASAATNLASAQKLAAAPKLPPAPTLTGFVVLDPEGSSPQKPGEGAALQSLVKPDARTTVFCAVWSKDPMRWQLLKGHQACLDNLAAPVKRVYVFDDGDVPPRWLKGEHVVSAKPLAIYEAWALAIERASTPYVMNLNLDDRLCPSGVLLLEAGLDQGADLVGGEWRIEFSQASTDGACDADLACPIGSATPKWPPDPAAGTVLMGTGSGARHSFGPATAWRAALHAELGAYPHSFPDGVPVRSIGDCMWWNILHIVGKRVGRVPHVIGRYHSHPSEQAEFRYASEERQMRCFLAAFRSRHVARLAAHA